MILSDGTDQALKIGISRKQYLKESFRTPSGA
jgi:hypothetical protein